MKPLPFKISLRLAECYTITRAAKVRLVSASLLLLATAITAFVVLTN